MSTEQVHLRQTLAELHRQLAGAGELDPAVAARLGALVAEIERALDSGQPVVRSQGRSIGERLGEATREFEASHPTLSGTIGSVIDALAQMGI